MGLIEIAQREGSVYDGCPLRKQRDGAAGAFDLLNHLVGQSGGLHEAVLEGTERQVRRVSLDRRRDHWIAHQYSVTTSFRMLGSFFSSLAMRQS